MFSAVLDLRCIFAPDHPRGGKSGTKWRWDDATEEGEGEAEGSLLKPCDRHLVSTIPVILVIALAVLLRFAVFLPGPVFCCLFFRLRLS